MSLRGLAELADEILSAELPVAVLAGAGTSYSAGLPTGQDLLRGLASATGSPAGIDPVTWYERQFGRFPDYFTMMGATEHADTLPAAHFDGLRPTPAHRAIADLAAAGLVGPVITTNVDALLEQAMLDRGLAPRCAHSLATIRGLDLAGHVVVKPHGDHRDLSIRRSTARLHTYHPAVAAALSRILTTFDLLICGWSASWDLPLGELAAGAAGRRAFWLQCGPPTTRARRIMAARQATVCAVESSDAGLSQLCALLLGGAAAATRSQPKPSGKDCSPGYNEPPGRPRDI
ncbi:MAG: hypothetical protein IRZ08_18430 [Frankia sp.]|nr:hypothetical protein [Frankia sp.]